MWMRLWLTPRWRHSWRIDVPSKPRAANAPSRRSRSVSSSMTSGRISGPLVRREHRRLQAADEHQPEPEAAAPEHRARPGDVAQRVVAPADRARGQPRGIDPLDETHAETNADEQDGEADRHAERQRARVVVDLRGD